ncbi:Protein of unknown function [Modicisalibacter ilicicola DSM 19980]|uniref:DUF3833 domain-containing protein n=1 Tax=Modicisalibacter ilicicola DSM 19980 TaxID=1121942 RepID=A0A1M4XGQ0_9GAMM|nr:DUF3833 domain-containing protein [Halomonas ilicicola]SHE92513.1 Protein of unknown function [Halomonas ilicicola DSM 19980]
MKRFSMLLIVVLVWGLTACAGVDTEDYAGTEPRLDIGDYFQGETRAWGMVQDYSGKVQRRFTVDITGRLDGSTLTLDERFTYADGETDRRVWTFERLDEHRWRGEADDVEGSVHAESYGHVFHMRYPLEVDIDGSTWTFSMDDWMYLQPDGRLINRTTMSKLGITLGEITLVFERSR